MRNDSGIAVVALMGPTASGKSSLAMELAESLDGELVSADSAQVYRQVSIGTAKPSRAELQAVPHHLIDIKDLGEGFSLAEFQSLASEAIASISARGKLPVIVGGTGLYVRGLLEGYTLTAPPPDEALRRELSARPLEDLLAELQQRDAATFETIDRCNKRRVVRALEVIRQTGRSFKESSRRCPPPWRVVKLGLHWSREELNERIGRRLAHMLQAGWIEEVAALIEGGWEERLQKAEILGYGQICDYLHQRLERQQMEEDIRLATCRFAKRQRTWLRAEPNLIQLEGKEQVRAQALELIRSTLQL